MQAKYRDLLCDLKTLRANGHACHIGVIGLDWVIIFDDL